jgi:sugar phosphate isomerase/epimerase
MRLIQSPDCHLSYCTNIHPGESWSEVDQALKKYLPAIKKTVSPDREMGVGLRLSALATRQLSADNSLLTAFKDWLHQQQLYIYTVNGFPYGTFHGETIKEKVYRPDWAEPERLAYSMQLGAVLCALLPPRQHGSVSTVPVGFKPEFASPDRLQKAVNHLLQLAAFLAELEYKSGKLIQFALEPEPGCFLETTHDTVVFFQQRLFSDDAVSQLLHYLPAELKPKANVALLKRHLGVCLDTCHAAVMFERPLMMLQTLTAAGIPVHKIQLTAALSVKRLDPAVRKQLLQFADQIYLHQTSTRSTGDPQHHEFYLDLEPALDKATDDTELRSHFHVPVFAENLGSLQTTQRDLIDLLAAFRPTPPCAHLEVETYTFDLLPAGLKQDSVVAHVSREINWVKEQLER